MKARALPSSNTLLLGGRAAEGRCVSTAWLRVALHGAGVPAGCAARTRASVGFGVLHGRLRSNCWAAAGSPAHCGAASPPAWLDCIEEFAGKGGGCWWAAGGGSAVGAAGVYYVAAETGPSCCGCGGGSCGTSSVWCPVPAPVAGWPGGVAGRRVEALWPAPCGGMGGGDSASSWWRGQGGFGAGGRGGGHAGAQQAGPALGCF
jgi:hypothetical protein